MQLECHKQFLRKIDLDLDTVCPANCPRTSGYHLKYWEFDPLGEGTFNIAALLHLIWSEDLRVALHVTQPKNEAYSKRFEPRPSTTVFHDVQCEALNHIIRSIQEGALDLKKFGHLISYVTLRRDAQGGPLV